MDNNENIIYLRTKVKPILEPLFVEIGRRKPDDVINFSIDWLKRQTGEHTEAKAVPEENN